jgi:two-component system CheB/CheR fusion protein
MEHLFAEPELWSAIASQLHALLPAAVPERGLRAWVAGCGTGEDAYAAAMLLHQAAAQAEPALSISVFATETNLEELTAARAGVYPAARLALLAPALREQFFFRRAGQEQVKATLRERVLFASHRLLGDPPFSHLDVLICRALFDALTPEQQAEALSRFAFALRPEGLLLLSAGPEVAPEDPRFRSVGRDRRLLARTAAPARPPGPRPSAAGLPELHVSPRWEPADRADSAPLPALIVDERLQIVHLGAGVERFLRLASGTPSYHLLQVVRPDLRAALSATISRAQARGRAAESLPAPVTTEGVTELVTVIVQVAAPHAEGLIVQFDAVTYPDAAPAPLIGGRTEQEPAVDLAALQAEHDVIYEELRVANEELQVVNEELYVSMEELQVRREELETLNEQLQTLNQEQQRTLDALARTNADLENLIASADIGTLFLNRELRLQRYTEPARQVVNLLPADLGRPFAHLTHQLQYAGLLDDIARVLAELAPSEREAPHADGRWFLVRLRPYRTAERQITGVVLTFLEITERKWAEEVLRQSYDELERRVRQRTAELAQANAASQALMRELVTAQEAERLRLARELHDTLGQQITAALLGLQSVRGLSQGRAATLAALDHVREIVQAMGREMHEIAVALRPTALDDVGLAGALRGYVEGWSRRTGVAAELFVAGVEPRALPPEVETTLYRVAQEALTNVARHAGASRVSVVLESDGGRVVAAIEDNGRGFDPDAAAADAQQRRRLGLLGMQERAALVGGTLTVESQPGGGTTVIARIPLRGRS